MKHVFFVPPVELQPEDIDFPAYHVTWLQAIPISEGEYQYAVKHGTEALMDLLEEQNADIADRFRDSVV